MSHPSGCRCPFCSESQYDKDNFPEATPPEHDNHPQFRDVGFRVDRYGNMVFKPELVSEKPEVLNQTDSEDFEFRQDVMRMLDAANDVLIRYFNSSSTTNKKEKLDEAMNVMKDKVEIAYSHFDHDFNEENMSKSGGADHHLQR